jgi:hypothetical protein
VDGNYYAGMGVSPSSIQGVSAQIEWFNTSLCIQDPDTPDWSWSLSWIGLIGPDDPNQDGFDIFQGGFGKCVPSGVGSCPGNAGISYHWWFWEYEAGACGNAQNSTFRKANKGNASAGTYLYKIDHRPASSRYSFSIDGTDQTFITESTVSTCWGGVSGAQIMNEMLDYRDQDAGTVGNHQEFSAVKYQNGSGFHSVNWAPGSCDANSQPSNWACNTSAASDRITTWDFRAP